MRAGNATELDGNRGHVTANGGGDAAEFPETEEFCPAQEARRDVSRAPSAASENSKSRVQCQPRGNPHAVVDKGLWTPHAFAMRCLDFSGGATAIPIN